MYRKSMEKDCRVIYDLICDMEKKKLPYEKFAGIYLRQLQRRDMYCLLDEEAGKVRAILNLRFEEQLHHCEKIAEVMEFVVDAHCRKQKVGKRMFAEAEKVAREQGCSQIEVACNQLRKDTHRFYEREGMHNFHYKFSKRLIGEDSDKNILGR
ncbi:GNAT family N-acetyltransferase [Anaerotignum sp.]